MPRAHPRKLQPKGARTSCPLGWRSGRDAHDPFKKPLCKIQACALGLLIAVGGQAFAGTVAARVEDGGRSLIIEAPGLAAFRSGFAATVEIDGVRHRLDSSAGTVVGTTAHTAKESALGPVSGTTSAIRFEKEQIELLFRLDRVMDAPQVVLIQAGIRNLGNRPVRLFDLAMLTMDNPPESVAAGAPRFLQVAGRPGEWLLTGLHAMTPVRLNFGEMRKDAWLHEQGGFYRSDGTGFLFGPAGVPAAYLSMRFTPSGDGRAGMMLVSSMDGVRVNQGQVRWGQQAGLFFEPPQPAMARWTDWVARTHGARVAKGALTGWSSVYSPERIARGTDVLSVVEQIGKSNGRLQPSVIQIGESFEPQSESPANIESLYPEGLPFYARKISEAGLRAGLKLEFALPDMTMDQCIANVRQAVRDGFSYLKIGYHQRPAFRESLAGGDKTSFEVFRENMQALRNAAGEDTYIMFCEWYADRATVGLVDASRIGPVTTRSGVRDVMKSVLVSYQLNGRWFAVDNDCYYMATELKDISPVVGGWPLARTWISMVGLSCGAAFTSDMWNEARFKPYWRNVEVLTPPARERTEVLDICTAAEWTRLVGHVRRDWGDATVALLWNPEDREKPVDLNFQRAGMDPNQRYAVWSFWDNRYLGLAQESWTTPALAPSASQHLRFTPVPSASVPVLIGSNLHIYCGAAEIKRVRSSRSCVEIELTDAGARSGDLFLYSRFLPVLRTVSGMQLGAIDQAGENVWRVRLRDRQYGAAQRIELGILLPVTSQWWFWAMIAVMVASVLVAIGRYVAWLRLQREHSLATERSRIARDIHDDLGVSLTQIAMQCELIQDDLDQPEAMGRHVEELFQSARAATRTVDEIVWAVTPGNDTLEKFTAFTGQFVALFLKPSGLSCRLTLPDNLPDLPMEAARRHHLYLVIREALHNIIRHAKATTVRFSLALNDGRQLVITIADDGCGFDPGQASGAGRVFGGNGLANMRKRMDEIGGTLEIASAPGGGTIMTLRARL